MRSPKAQVIPLAQWRAYNNLDAATITIEDSRRPLKEIVGGNPAYPCRDSVLALVERLAYELHQYACALPPSEGRDQARASAWALHEAIVELRKDRP